MVFLGLFLAGAPLAYAIYPFPTASTTAETAAYIVWRTDVPGTSQVNYGPTSSYGTSTAKDKSLVTYHEQTISGLTPGTVYHFQVVSVDGSGNSVSSKDYTFTTLAAPTGTVKTVKSTGGDYTSVQACANAASAGWTCEVYSGGASDKTAISISTGGSSGSPVTFIAHDAVEVPGFSIGSNASYVTIEGFEISTSPYSAYQSCSVFQSGVTFNGTGTSGNNIIRSDYIHNIYWGHFVAGAASTVVSNYDQLLNNIMAFTAITNQNPPYSYFCTTPAPGQVGILLTGSHNLVDGNDIQEADHLIELGGSYDIARRNVAHDTYAADWGASNVTHHVDFFHPTNPTTGSLLGRVSIHQVYEDNQDYNRNDANEHFLLDEGYAVQSIQQVGTGDGTTKTFSGTLSLGSDTAIAPFSVDVVVCSASPCTVGNSVAYATDNGFGALRGKGTGTVTYSGVGAGKISVTFSTAPAKGYIVGAFYALQSYGAHDVIVRGNIQYYVGSALVGGGEGGLSGARIYNNTAFHIGYGGTSSNANSTAINMFSGSSITHASPNWVVVNDIFYDAFGYSSYTPWAWKAGAAGYGAFMAPPEYAPGYSLVFTSACDPSPGCSYLSATTSAPGMVIGSNPGFASPQTYDFQLQSGSPAVNAGVYLTKVASTDTGSGTSLIVDDAGFFQDGYGIPGVDPDCISVTKVSNHVCIVAVDYQTNTLTLASPISRSAGDPVWLYSDSTGRVVLLGSAANIGASLPSQPAPVTVMATSH